MNPDIKPAYAAPETRYLKTKELFDIAIGKDFIEKANLTLNKDRYFIVGLSHGISPAGAYQYILNHFEEIQKPDKIIFAYIHSPFRSQENLVDITDAVFFLKALVKRGLITKQQVIGRHIDPASIEDYTKKLNKRLAALLEEHSKAGLDYVFLAANPQGRVAGIERRSKAFASTDIFVVVTVQRENEITVTPDFLKRSAHIAFLATKSDKRRPLAWLYAVWGKPDESPSFLRYMDNVEARMTVFIDDEALTWPQVEVKRTTSYGISNIRIDLAKPYNPSAREKLPVIILIHGFLGLNSYDGLLTAIQTKKYIAAAMHYGSIPYDLPVSDYSNHVAHNIDAVVSHFGAIGHPVYIFDHSMGNIYIKMIDRNLEEYQGIKTYLKGRIGANPFFGIEAKHALIGFLDNVIIPSLVTTQVPAEKAFFFAFRRIVPFDSKRGVRRRGINLSEMLINNDSVRRDRIWALAKRQILYLMSNMDSLPHLNRIPIEKALNRLPAKIFAIQTHSALEESIKMDRQVGLVHFPEAGIPTLILKSERDAVAKFVPRFYEGKGVEIIDITDQNEKDLFREHLFHMVNPIRTTKIIDDFVTKTQQNAIDKDE